MTEQSRVAASPFAMPLGLCSPLWPAYGLMMGASLQWWALSRLAKFASPVWAYEPKHDGAAPVQEPPAATIPLAEVEAEPAPAWAAPIASEAETVVQATADVALASAESTGPEADTVPALGPGDVDELTLIRGIGPRVADALVERGVTTFRQLAAWSERDMHHFDTELKLLGRSKRYDFLGQAKALASEA